jgi:hypothetical protein
MKKEKARTQLVTAADLIPPFHVGLAKQVRRISMVCQKLWRNP